MDANTLRALGFLILIVILANLSERRAGLRPLVYGAFLVINTLFIVAYGVLIDRSQPLLSPETILLTRFIAFSVGIVATLLLLTPVRQRLAVLFAYPAEAPNVGFAPASMLHMTALILCLYFLTNVILHFVLGGGLSGLAATYQPEDSASLLVQMVLFIVFAVLGVGLGVRRSPGKVLSRLGLRAPNLGELTIGAGMAVALFMLGYFVVSFWASVTPSNLIDQQTQVSRLIADSIDTLSMAFLVTGTAAVGEEIIFRGALQPVFGLWPTAIFFALAHIQYTLTPATLIIVFVALGLGWLRREYNTTTAIVAHFLYDFVPLALGVIMRYTDSLTKLSR